LLRVLKLLKAFPELQVIVSALISGMGSIGYIGVILVLVFYVFGILGMILFQENDPWHFGTLWDAMFSLFRAATLEDWTDIMYTQTEGCANYGAFVMCADVGQHNCSARIDDESDLEAFNELFCCCPEKSNPQPFAGYVFWVIFTILGAQVLLTLFIGVITTSMEEAQEAQKQEKNNEQAIEVAASKMGLSNKTVELYKTVFTILDTDRSGGIDEDELKTGLKEIGIEPDETQLEEMYLTMENDGSEDITYVEFMKLMCSLKKKDIQRQKTLQSQSSASSLQSQSSVRSVTDSGDEVPPNDNAQPSTDIESGKTVEMIELPKNKN
jgi:Ca2+-binding EF-hand superfamily protein